MSDPTPPLSSTYEFSPPIEVVVVKPPPPRYWLHALLLLATFFTTLVVGAGMQFCFQNDLPLFSADESAYIPFFPIGWILSQPSRLLLGLPFSLSVLLILMSHEMGHYVYCLRNRVSATLPYFIPVPTPIGTMGAFILIRSRIRSRMALFDIGIAGPIAGFIVAVVALFLGLALSRPLPIGPIEVQFGLPMIFSLAQHAIAAVASDPVHHLPVSSLSLHPIAIAAWVGMFATSLNLLPGGQLDGGHITYAVAPRLHRYSSVLAFGILLPLGFLWAGWWLFGTFLLITGWRHPQVPQWPGLDSKRRWLAVLALVMFLLTVTAVPIVIRQ